MTIRSTFISVYTVTLLLLAALVILSIFMMQNQSALSHAEKNRYESYLLADELRQSSDDLTRLARTYVSTQDSKYEDTYWDILAVRGGKKPRADGRTIALNDLMKKAGFTDAEFGKLTEAGDNSNDLVTTETIAMNAIKGLYDDGSGNYVVKKDPDPEMARRIMFDDKYHKDKAKIVRPIDEFFVMLDKRTAATAQDLQAKANYFLVAILALIVILGIFSIFSLIFILGKVIKPLGNTVDVANALASGDFSKRLKLTSDNEIGQLSTSIDAMADNLEDQIAQANKAMEEAGQEAEKAKEAMVKTEEAMKVGVARQEGMRNVAERLTVIVEQVTSSSEELSAQVEQSSQGTEEQKRMTTEAATAMEEMNATVLEVAKNATNAADSAENAKSNAEGGEEVVEKVVSSISAVQEQAVGMKEGLSSLGKQAEGIGQVMNVITDIADQTNLLALNAAIEAARAGDAGRGFAVVADEVRKLAEKTMAATKEVGAVVSSIQDGTKANIRNMDEAYDAIGESNELATQAGTSLREIVNIVETTADQVRSIATASEQQSASSEEINRNMESINRISVQNSESMAQSAQAISDLARMAQDLKTVIDELRDQM